MDELTPNDFLKKYSDIHFDSKYHRYWTIDDKGKKIEFISATQFLDKFKEDRFTPEAITKYALKNGLPSEIVADWWSAKGKFSTGRGSEVHLYIQTFFQCNGKESVIPLDCMTETEVKYFHNFWDDHKERLLPIQNEFRIYNKKFRIAGTIDFLARSLKTNKYHIFDWKTGKKIDKVSSFKNKYLSPLEAFDECEYIEYSLQLSMYKYLLQLEFGIDLGDNFLVWLNRKNENYEMVKCLDMTPQIHRILTDRIDSPTSSMV